MHKTLNSLNQDNDENILLASDKSYWLRDQQRFIRVGQAVSKDLLNDISIFSFNDQAHINWFAHADTAVRQNEKWQLNNFQRSRVLENNQVVSENSPSFYLDELFLNSFLKSVTTEPFKMSIRQLRQYIHSLRLNHLSAAEYEVALYKKLAVPLTGLAMTLLALPLVFRPRQLGGVGQRLLLGIITALLAYIFVEAIGNAAIVYQLPAVLMALSAPLFIFACAFLMFRLNR